MTTRAPGCLLLLALLATPALAQERRPLTADALLGDGAASRPGAGLRPNALLREKSPYLREHAFDPVDWHAWGPGAFEEARRRDVPLFVSSGYSTCHWCHVMHRQSFESSATARKLNASFVCVKIDREELPDVDDALIHAASAFQGSAGWPCTVVLQPDGKPFWGGTYLPREDLEALVAKVDELWRDPKQRRDLARDANEVARRLQDARGSEARSPLDASLVEKAVRAFESDFDASEKGFGPPPKFPRAPELAFLLRAARTSESARRMVTETLDAILAGGIHDQLGGGFHRYATDARWRVPHFEKTLYDNAQLASVFADAWRLTREPRYAEAARSTLDYLLRDLALASGGLASGEDADSSGQEGLFYTWTVQEVLDAVPGRAGRFAVARFGVVPAGEGPVDGRSVLYLATTLALAAKAAGIPEAEAPDVERGARERLLAVRAARVRPRRDDKVLAGWNGLAIGALARAGALLTEPRYLDAASRAFALVESRLRTPDGGVLRRLTDGDARFPGALEDYAYLAHGAVELYLARLDAGSLEAARGLLDQAIARAWDPASHAFRTRPSDADKLLPFTGGGSVYEGATPAAAAVLCEELLRMSALTGSDELRACAKVELESMSSALANEPTAVPTYLAAFARELVPTLEIVLAGKRGPELDALEREIRKHDVPLAVVALVDPLDPRSSRVLGDLAKDRGPTPDGRPQAFVCVGSTCRLPVSSPEALAKLLDHVVADTHTPAPLAPGK